MVLDVVKLFGLYYGLNRNNARGSYDSSVARLASVVYLEGFCSVSSRTWLLLSIGSFGSGLSATGLGSPDATSSLVAFYI